MKKSILFFLICFSLSSYCFSQEAQKEVPEPAQIAGEIQASEGINPTEDLTPVEKMESLYEDGSFEQKIQKRENLDSQLRESLLDDAIQD